MSEDDVILPSSVQTLELPSSVSDGPHGSSHGNDSVELPSSIDEEMLPETHEEDGTGTGDESEEVDVPNSFDDNHDPDFDDAEQVVYGTCVGVPLPNEVHKLVPNQHVAEYSRPPPPHCSVGPREGFGITIEFGH